MIESEDRQSADPAVNHAERSRPDKQSQIVLTAMSEYRHSYLIVIALTATCLSIGREEMLLLCNWISLMLACL